MHHLIFFFREIKLQYNFLATKLFSRKVCKKLGVGNFVEVVVLLMKFLKESILRNIFWLENFPFSLWCCGHSVEK